MNNSNIIIRQWPQAIMHLDADSFFASCEQSLHPEYKGLPVITGAERGIVSAASYEARDLGIKRGVPLNQVKQICPDAIILPSDYESYSLISGRMFNIIRRYIPQVEEYSIDEAFADLSGLRRPLHTTYQGIAQKIKEQIETELDITVSIGVSLSKSLAKLAANLQKPSGLTMVPGQSVENLLKMSKLEKIWGFGNSTVSYLHKYGLTTAYDFAVKSEYWVKEHLNKNGLEIWHELRGRQIYEVSNNPHTEYKSISKVKTFSPPSSNKEYLLAQIIRNLESACIKARRYHLSAQRLVIYLKQQNFQSQGIEIKLDRASNSALMITPLLKYGFDQIFKSGYLYRATGVVLNHLQADNQIQETLFTDKIKIDKLERLTNIVDIINSKFGKHSIHQAASLSINNTSRGKREARSLKWTNAFKGETYRQHLNLPRWSMKVN